MKRTWLLFLLILGACSLPCRAIPGDLNTDEEVNFADFAILASGWQTTYDADDLSIMADNWLYGHEAVNAAPTIDSNSIPAPNTVAYDDCYITLVGSDKDGPADKLAYVITQLPATGNLYDMAEWETGWITSARLPYQIGNFSNQIVYRGFVATTDSFKYKVFDGELYSEEATVNITVSPASADSLCFDGSSLVTIPDVDDVLDIVDGRGIAWFFRTTQSNGGLLSKRNASGGYEVRLENGRLRVCLYDSSGPVGCYGRIDNYRVDTGRWYIGAFAYNAGNMCVIIAGIENGDTWYMQNDYTGVPTGPYTNTADLYVGKATGFNNFIGEFDRLRFYSGCTGGGLDLRFTIVTLPTNESRTMTDSAMGFGSTIEPDVRFMFDEGTGSTLTDDRGGLEATATGIEWLPAKGNEPVPVNPLTDKGYRFKKYKRPYDQPSMWQMDDIIDSRTRY